MGIVYAVLTFLVLDDILNHGLQVEKRFYPLNKQQICLKYSKMFYSFAKRKRVLDVCEEIIKNSLKFKTICNWHETFLFYFVAARD